MTLPKTRPQPTSAPLRLRVAVPAPLTEALDYLWPGPGPPPRRGCRVRVPLRNSERIGVVVGHPEQAPRPAPGQAPGQASRPAVRPPPRLKRVIEVLDDEPLLTGELLETLQWCADYYHYPVGEVLSQALPGLLRRGRNPARANRGAWMLTAAGRAQDPAAVRRRARRQADVLERLAAGAADPATLRARGIGSEVLRRMTARGWIRRAAVTAGAPEEVAGGPAGAGAVPDLEPDAGPETGPDPGAGSEPDAATGRGPDAGADSGPGAAPDSAPDGRAVSGAGSSPVAGSHFGPDAGPDCGPDAAPQLTAEQRRCLDSIAAGPAGYAAYLLQGVTGSGKTEVYLRLIARELAAGRQSLLLVPEIGLTPQLIGRLRKRFAQRLAVMHSGLSATQRLDAWQDARTGAARLILGTRSAVFTPFAHPGLIIVDEEHDPSFKQQDGFRYSARDLAVLRARQLNVPILLASATPSLESVHNAARGQYRLLTIRRRIGAAGHPTMRVIDMNRHGVRRGLSTPLVAAIQRHLEDDCQVLLFLNRRGFAPVLLCPTCGAAEACNRCDARMTVHAASGRLCCHHCGRTRPLSWVCEACRSERLAVGAGTQRIGDELAALFPAARIARLDRDTAARRGGIDRVLADVARGHTQILVGTQMLAKGHDFPRVTLVGVLNADQGLFGTDYRSTERFAQILLQVAGRAGRRERAGEVFVQSHYPRHPLLRQLADYDYSGFARAALAEREASGWPPFAHLILWRAEAPRRAPAHAFLEQVAGLAREWAAGVRVLGPAAPAMERRGGRYRAQLLFQSRRRTALHRLMADIEPRVRAWPAARRVRWSIDVDPIEA